jgi:hypothetical protein
MLFELTPSWLKSIDQSTCFWIPTINYAEMHAAMAIEKQGE